VHRLDSIDDVRDLVRSERKRRGLTQAQAAGLAGYTQKWLSHFEAGDVNPPAHMVFQLLNTLGIKLFYQTPQNRPVDSTDGDEELSL